MAARRPRGAEDEEGSGGGAHHHRYGPRRIRPALAFSTIVRRAVAAQTSQEIVRNLEPVIRRVVREEIENIFSQHGDITLRTLPLRIQEQEATPPLKLVFVKCLKLPIFTNNKLVDAENSTIGIQLVDTRTNYPIIPPNNHLYSSLRLEVLVLDGDFRYEDGDSWTAHQFSAAIVKAREGKRPLIIGTLNVQMSNHGVAEIDDVSFTDNSSWIRSRKFRIGVRVMQASYCGPRIQEAVSESFTVKDHRGELYKKHYPPLLTDNVWRLKNIGKDGPIDKRLGSKGIKNVQDFLMLNTIDPEKLKHLLGMSDKQWGMTLNHAKSCDIRGKCYVFKTERYDITFNPIGEILATRIGDQTCSFHELHPQQQSQVKELANVAYRQWDQLEVVLTEVPPAAKKSLIIEASNSGWEPCDSQDQGSMISSGTQNARCLEYIGNATSSAAPGIMTTNSSSTSYSTSAVPANHTTFWSQSSIAADDNFGWQNSTNPTCWDQVD
ncbi:hypothetical protein ACP4OV_027735 [Aristida adscensionis]